VYEGKKTRNPKTNYAQEFWRKEYGKEDANQGTVQRCELLMKVRDQTATTEEEPGEVGFADNDDSVPRLQPTGQRRSRTGKPSFEGTGR